MASTASIAQNIDHIELYVARIGWATGDGDGGTDGPIKTANTAKDGTGTVNTLFTAATNGSIIRRIRFVPVGENVASVARLFINNGGSSGTADNNILWREVSLEATSATEVAAQDELVIHPDLYLPGSYKILVTIGTTVAAGWRVMAEGGDF